MDFLSQAISSLKVTNFLSQREAFESLECLQVSSACENLLLVYEKNKGANQLLIGAGSSATLSILSIQSIVKDLENFMKKLWNILLFFHNAVCV